MTPTDKTSRTVTSSKGQWTGTYTQGDVDTIREQIEQDEAAKRRFLLIALFVTGAALAGVIVLLSTNYGLYARSESAKKRLEDDNSALRAGAQQCQQQLDALREQEKKSAQVREEAKSRMEKLVPLVLRESAGGGDTAGLAQMIYNLPEHKIEVEQKPPESLFRNWRVKTDSATEVFTLVGGFVDGKWVVYSNLLSRK